MVLFLPNEEHTRGARAMVDDGPEVFMVRFLTPCGPVVDILLQQCFNPIRSCRISIKSGLILLDADTVCSKFQNIRLCEEDTQSTSSH